MEIRRASPMGSLGTLDLPVEGEDCPANDVDFILEIVFVECLSLPAFLGEVPGRGTAIGSDSRVAW